MSANATANLSSTDARYKTQADQYLADSLRILRELQDERKRTERASKAPSKIVEEVKEILNGAS